MPSPSVSRYWIAYSGGLDSHVLLHAMSALRPVLPNSVVHAVHINHGLQHNAQQWEQHCAQVCAVLQIPYTSLTVNAHPAPGESPEAAARHARYTALGTLIEPGDCLLTAHHQDDQAETMLLQLLRGAGPHGLAAMPASTNFGKGQHLRPLLGFTHAQLKAYAEQHGLHWIDDQSNLNTDFDRNYLRHEIIPRLRARWPAAARTLARSAQHAADAAHLLDDFAQDDLVAVQGPSPATLIVSSLQELSAARQRNVLRGWLDKLGLPLPNAAHIKHILTDIVMAAPDSNPLVHWPGAEVRRYRDLIYVMQPLMPHDPSQIIAWDLSGPLTLPSGLGELSYTRAQGAGIKATLCQDQTITVRFRRGGERCRPVGRQHSHELRKLFQERGIPPWQRDRVPLIYIDEQLAAVVGLWVCHPLQAVEHETGFILQMCPCSATHGRLGGRM